ncbi:protein SAWADEE HOMEODOMAIN HOMOLOG 2-like [Bidens hawaiensis]|uniref:protein SAWADEE HOMEODOMAIN HOMOLOG 2-like n=1 Tax=Bidens hawaiensis TaxID=980011 RepID=UPI00404B20DC
MAVSGVNYDLEFRCNADDAWYTCAVVLEHGNQFRVKFKDFLQTYFDEVFTVTDFNTHGEIEQLIRKFRPISKPVEDNECSRLTEGVTVNALYRRQEDARYFDAVVDAVQYKEHTPDKCVCSYLLCWQHGPGEGTITAASIEDICFIIDGDIHPKVSEFTDLVKQKLKGTSVQSQASFSVFLVCDFWC